MNIPGQCRSTCLVARWKPPRIRRLSQVKMSDETASARWSIKSGTESMSYSSSGVSIEDEASSVAALVGCLKNATRPRKTGEFGALVDHQSGFSGLVEFGNQLLAMCTDGVGSKLLLCSNLGYYESIALDCVAMNVNDLICIGAEPLAFVDYIAAPRPSPKIWSALGRSLGKASEIARVSLCGGETATLPDMVKDVDMSGTALGWVPRGEQIDGRRITDKDVIIGLPSSGVHSNGFSLVRKILDMSGLTLMSSAPFSAENDQSFFRAGGSIWRHSIGERCGSVTIGEVFLNPTFIYVNPVVDLFNAVRTGNGPCERSEIHGLAHITGGGLSNLLRLHGELGYRIEDPIQPQPEFEWMQEVGRVTNFEMYRTFNMGMGMAVITSASSSKAVAKWLNQRLPGTKIVGEVDSSGIVTHCTTGVKYEKY